jgi:hypothetical protein
MTTKKYIKSIEKIIEENQQIQMLNPPTSKAWQEASKEINRLAKLIIEARKRKGAMDIKVRIHAARQEMNHAHEALRKAELAATQAECKLIALVNEETASGAFI